MKAMAILALMGALGLGKPWTTIAWAQDAVQKIKKIDTLEQVAVRGAQIHEQLKANQEAGRREQEWMRTLVIQNARGGARGFSSAHSAADDAMNQQIVVLGTRIGELSTERDALRIKVTKLESALKMCEDAAN
jgi:hypothetical protein